MYINNIWVIYYLLIGIVGLMVGKVTSWANTVYIEEKTPKIRDFWKVRKEYLNLVLFLLLYLEFLIFQLLKIC